MMRDGRPGLAWLCLHPDLEIPPRSWSESGWEEEMVLKREENGDGKET